MSKFFKPLIGLEMHVELSTKSKMFCQCDAHWQTYKPNENTCPVCLGLPGALPVPNKKAIEYTMKIAKALGCTVREKFHFDRKHYFYPDLPKGYQISQYDEPIGVNGRVSVMVKDAQGAYVEKSFRIHRVHLEEDTGKLTHAGEDTLVDFNRSSVPLVEIVTEADFTDSMDVKSFLQEIHTIITYLGVSDADMESGSMRLEPNISVRDIEAESEPADWSALPFPAYKVEVKNINSFNFVKKAIDYEVERQTDILRTGAIPQQETRGWNEDKNITYSQRSKENAHDYRYFPEPDIPPFEYTAEAIAACVADMPELPLEKVRRYTTELHIKPVDALAITREPKVARYFDAVLAAIPDTTPSTPQAIANAIINKKISTDLPVQAFVEAFAEAQKPKVTDFALLHDVIQKTIQAQSKSVADYRSGKVNVIMFLVGQVMREMKGKADAQTVKTELEKALQ